MKYSINAQDSRGRGIAAGHLSAASALAGVSELKGQGACAIQIFDIKTGRLVDEAALVRADDMDRRIVSRRPGQFGA